MTDKNVPQSRSMLRRLAIQKGEPMPEFDRDYLAEAKRILAGETPMLPQIEHLRALVASEKRDSDLAIKAEALNMVLAVVSAKAGVETPLLVDMLKQAEEELRAKRWLS